jgi:hypothetical protein
MTVALPTLAILTLFWFVSTLMLQMFEESGSKILAAFKGRSPQATAPVVQSISWKVSTRGRTVRPMRARPTLRVAA